MKPWSYIILPVCIP